MAYISKLVSCKTVLAAIERTFKPASSSWINEAVEDIGWAIQAIGYHAGLSKKTTEPPYITVSNNRGKIPCGVERILHVEQLIPITSSGKVLNPDGTTPFPQEELDSCTYKGVRMRLGTDTSNYGVSERSTRTTEAKSDEPYYNLDDDFVITEFTTGLIKLHYVGFALDKEGFPKILDDADYKLACQWYCVQNMILKGFKHPEISFKDAFDLWEMYRLRAENAPKMPSLDGAERFRYTWNRVSNNIDYGANFYMGLEQQEFIDKS